MKGRRITIARWLGLTAILAVNLALLRTFHVAGVLPGGDLIFVALQVGLWGLLRSPGRLRRFWAGFVAPNMAAALVLLLCEPELLDRLLTPYRDIADYLEITYLPTPLAGSLGNELWEVELAVVYFVPVLFVALLGGITAAWLTPRGLRPARAMNLQESTARSG